MSATYNAEDYARACALTGMPEHAREIAREFAKDREKLATFKVAVASAAEILGDWLTDNTDLVFEEQPEIDSVRTELLDALEKV
jgi:hypothetical protein